MITLRGLILLLLFSLPAKLPAQTGEQEANLKAAFIYNFTRYIEWETDNDKNDFIIGVVGNSPITQSLIEIAKNNTVRNKRLVIKQYATAEDIQYCHILFISKKSELPLQQVLDRTGKGTLTIGEENGFAKLGTAFNFIIINDKLKFEANLKSIYSAGLKASSQLLKLAVIVD
ncbi:MAG: YfiR family protein [Ferruginibacter sp.]